MFIPSRTNIIGAPSLGLPISLQQSQQQSPIIKKVESQIIPQMQEANLDKGVNFVADHSGCGFWRMFWPSDQINARMDGVIMSISQMIGDANFFHNIKTIRIQRQATPQQFEYVKFLLQLKQKFNFHLIYEIDDVMFYEDIPEYNHFKPGFSAPEVRESSKLIIQSCDEITTTTKTIAKYYAEKTGNNRVTVIPNFIPKWWAGNFYDEKKISKYYDQNRKKPRILYAGSGAHADVDGRCNNKDDFYQIIEAVRKTVNKFHWVFYGILPRQLVDLLNAGKIEYHPWTKLYSYPETVMRLKCQAMVAPLQDNIFNRCKSEIKITEGGAFGLIPICQDLEPYEKAEYKFTTGDEMIDQLNTSLKNKDTFMKSVRRNRAETEKMFLENDENIGMWAELYKYPFQDENRKLINKFNLKISTENA